MPSPSKCRVCTIKLNRRGGVPNASTLPCEVWDCPYKDIEFEQVKPTKKRDLK